MAHKKAYGLIVSKSSKGKVGKIGKSAALFQNDSSEEDEAKKKSLINQELNAVAEKKKQTKQTKDEIERALKEDPSVYKYDEIYDEMEQKKQTIGHIEKEKNKKPKYIANLLKSAATRKREQERRVERSVQREREKEGDQFADKESFVTTAYRQKMIEQAQEEERLRKQDEMDAANDVTKQKDLSKFYRNLLDRNVAMGAPDKEQEQPQAGESKSDEKREESGKEQDSSKEYRSSQSKDEKLTGEHFRDDSSRSDRGKHPSKERKSRCSPDSSVEEAKGSRESKRSDGTGGERKGEKRFKKVGIRCRKVSSSESESSEFVERGSKGGSGMKESSGGKRHTSKSSNRRHHEEEHSSSQSSEPSPRMQSRSKRDRNRSQSSDRKYRKDDKSGRPRWSGNVEEERLSKRAKRRHNSRESSPGPARTRERDDESTRRNEQAHHHVEKQGNSASDKNVVDKERLKIFAKRNDSDNVLSARERYLARKQGRVVPIIQNDDSD